MFLFAGDSGYLIEPWMITPFAREERPGEDTPQSRFNKIHCSDRNCVERCIGLMKESFRAINDERVLHYDAVKACRIVVAVVVVHNLRVLSRIPLYQNRNLHNENHYAADGDELEGEDGNNEGEDEDDNDDVLLNLLARGRAARNLIVEELEAARAVRNPQ